MRRRGKVVWFSEGKGFGFIRPDGVEDDKSDIFVHFSGIVGRPGERRNLRDGQVVEYQEGEGKRGPMAIEVMVTQP